MKFVKIFLRTLFVLLSLACLAMAPNIGVAKAGYIALFVLLFGFVVTHPLNLNLEKFEGYDLDSYRIGVFALAGALLFAAAIPIVSAEPVRAVMYVVVALVMAGWAIKMIVKSKSTRNGERE